MSNDPSYNGVLVSWTDGTARLRLAVGWQPVPTGQPAPSESDEAQNDLGQNMTVTERTDDGR